MLSKKLKKYHKDAIMFDKMCASNNGFSKYRIQYYQKILFPASIDIEYKDDNALQSLSIGHLSSPIIHSDLKTDRLPIIVTSATKTFGTPVSPLKATVNQLVYIQICIYGCLHLKMISVYKYHRRNVWIISSSIWDKLKPNKLSGERDIMSKYNTLVAKIGQLSRQPVMKEEIINTLPSIS